MMDQGNLTCEQIEELLEELAGMEEARRKRQRKSGEEERKALNQLFSAQREFRTKTAGILGDQ